jgi:hypothetical protein
MAPAHDEAGKNESMMMHRMEGPSDDESMHTAPKRKHRRSISHADHLHKMYGKKRK